MIEPGFYSQQCLSLDDQLLVGPISVPSNAEEEGNSLHWKHGHGHKIRNSACGQAMEDPDIVCRHHESPVKHKNLHARKHVAVSAGNKLRLEEREK